MKNFVFNRGDLWWGINDDAKENMQSGHRPYVIISNNLNNRYSTNITVVPITTQEKRSLPTHCSLDINGVKCTVLGEMITTIPKNYFNKFIKRVTKEEFADIEKVVKIQLAFVEKTNGIYLLKEDKRVPRKKNIFARFFAKLFRKK